MQAGQSNNPNDNRMGHRRRQPQQNGLKHGSAHRDNEGRHHCF